MTDKKLGAGDWILGPRPWGAMQIAWTYIHHGQDGSTHRRALAYSPLNALIIDVSLTHADGARKGAQ